MNMNNLERLIISLIESDAMKGCFKKEIANILEIDPTDISDIWLETSLISGVATQVLKIATIDVEIKKENLMKLPFRGIYENCIVMEVGDKVL